MVCPLIIKLGGRFISNMKENFVIEGYNYWPSFYYTIVNWFYSVFMYEKRRLGYLKLDYCAYRDFYKNDSFVYGNGKYVYSYKYERFIYYDFYTEDFINTNEMFIYNPNKMFFIFILVWLFCQISIMIISIIFLRPSNSFTLLEIWKFWWFFLDIIFYNRECFTLIEVIILRWRFLKLLFYSRTCFSSAEIDITKFQITYNDIVVKFTRIVRIKWERQIKERHKERVVLLEVLRNDGKRVKIIKQLRLSSVRWMKKRTLDMPEDFVDYTSKTKFKK